MQTGLHAIGWSMQRLAVALAALVSAAVLAYMVWVFVLVLVQGVAAIFTQ